jgi:uncharacterized protein YciI
MPLFAVHALDRPDALALRLQHYAAHRAFIESGDDFGVNVVLAGPLQTADGEMMIGSLFLIAGESQEAVTKFVNADPFAIHHVWETVNVARFHRRRG